jgi:hypothetical protein
MLNVSVAGDTVYVGVVRTQASLGTVRVSWFIDGLNGLQPQLGFQVYSGNLTFLPVCTVSKLSLRLSSLLTIRF